MTHFCLPEMLGRMYSLSVWDSNDKQFLPLFDYEWRNVTTYVPATEAIITNTTLWLADNKENNHA